MSNSPSPLHSNGRAIVSMCLCVGPSMAIAFFFFFYDARPSALGSKMSSPPNRTIRVSLTVSLIVCVQRFYWRLMASDHH